MISFKSNHLFSLVAVFFLLCATIVAVSSYSCDGKKKTEMRVLCAGSLMVPFMEVEKAFELQYPDVDVLIEGHGSIQVIRHITELHEEADILAVADHTLIPMLMYPVTVPESNESYASWYAKFATNSLGIAYTRNSRYGSEINVDNWYEVLSRPDIKLGVADARLDACGYRTLMLLMLAGEYYNNDSIFKQVLGEFKPAIECNSDESLTTIYVPEILRPLDERIALRGSSIRLLALLDSGDIDYAFEYQSVASQHGLEFLELPAEINLGDAGYEELYRQVICRLDFHRFSSVQPVFTGEPIIYGITIPYNAPHSDLAIAFIELLLGGEGQQIFKQNYQPLLIPTMADKIDKAPLELREHLSQE